MTPLPMAEPSQKPRLGISACLLGEQVRFDGGHKRDRYISDQLAEYFDFIPVCPEMAIGMGVPRPTIHLVGDIRQPRSVGVKDASFDVTQRMESFSLTKVESLQQLGGYILKKDSPSCGMERVKVYPEAGKTPLRKGVGIYARVLMQRFPQLPVEEEGRLNDPVLRENFINRVFVHQRWQKLLKEGLTPARLIEFHSCHKYTVMGHSQAAYKRMGRLLSDLPKPRLNDISTEYFTDLMTTLQRRVTPKRHVNVLQHIMGYLKRSIDAGDKAELLNSIEAYRGGEVPLVVPVTLLRHYFRRHPDPYMLKQVYLRPHPDKMGLYNHL